MDYVEITARSGKYAPRREGVYFTDLGRGEAYFPDLAEYYLSMELLDIIDHS